MSLFGTLTPEELAIGEPAGRPVRSSRRADSGGEDALLRARRKRLGQYFTGLRLAKLLAALAEAHTASSILDPMAGSGDMLQACFMVGAHPPMAGAVEIDPAAHAQCVETVLGLRTFEASVVRGNAFDRETLALLPSLACDLVITNPPYVRYQRGAERAGDDDELPSARDVRSGLFSALDALPTLDERDRNLFGRFVANYSGLADLAVPSWLLCAGMVRVGGTLAMVVPEAWLSREYAQVVHYLLLRWFDIQYIVEDSQAAWFSDALVRTTLLIARRVPRKASAFEVGEGGFLRFQLRSQAADAGSLVGALYPGHIHPERRFAEHAREWHQQRRSLETEALGVQWVPHAQMAQNLRRASVGQSWLPTDEKLHASKAESVVVNEQRAVVPAALGDWVNERVRLCTLDECGVNVGQGLRTGANQFFYADFVARDDEDEMLRPASLFGISSVRVPADCVRPALRKQTELPPGYVVRAETLPGRLLALQDYALPEDLEPLSKRLTWQREHLTAYQPMPDALAALVRAAASANVGEEDAPRLIPELSAVAPNVRKADPRNPRSLPRFWYMLPDFAPRHRPDLLVARVNNGHPKHYLNEGRAALIDANFSTLWLSERASLDVYALLALLNSAWCVAAMEGSGAVLGGGALKLEASHLRRLPLPELNDAERKQLSCLGRALAECEDASKMGETREAIDLCVVAVLLPQDGAQRVGAKLTELRAIMKAKLSDRTRKA